jgi:AraC-like DNA-binding protein
MQQVETLCAYLTQKVAKLHECNSLLNPALPQVKLLYATHHTARTPVLYNPGVVILFQGRKTGYLGEKTFTYDASRYLMLTLPLPFECETFACAQHPMAGVVIRLDNVMLQDLLLAIGDDIPLRQENNPSGIHGGALDEALLCALDRLIDVMIQPLHARVLGPQIIREILFLLLQGENGGALHSLVNRQSHLAQIARALRLIEQQYAQPLSVELLARQVNMSVSAFHHNFKAMTSTSPLQYIKTYRLHQARTLMLSQGLKASHAALRVGYESPSQFSREFKRYFGVTPSDDMARLREAQEITGTITQ